MIIGIIFGLGLIVPNLRACYRKINRLIQLTCRHSEEESIHHCTWHLDHSNLLSPDTLLSPNNHSCTETCIRVNNVIRRGKYSVQFTIRLSM